MSDLSFISPFFIVSNLSASVSFYTEKLGFKVLYKSPEDDPFFAMIGRGNATLMLKAAGSPAPNHTRHEWARWDAYISATDPDALFEEFSAKGLTFHQTLNNDADGLRGFEVKDADGYILFFGKPKI